MDWLPLTTAQLLLFLTVLARVGGLVMTAPIFGTKAVPKQVRVVFAVVLAMVVAPTQCGTAVNPPQNMTGYAVLLGGELFIGLCLGLGIVILFSGVQVAGGLIGRMGGLVLADVFDPNSNENVPMFSQLLLFVTLAVFFCTGGHRIVMAALLDTFQTIPVGSSVSPHCVGEVFVALIQQSFLLGIRAAVPVIAALLLSTLVLGLIGRAVPQLNILTVGFGLNSMLAMAAVSFTLGTTAWLFQDQIEPTVQAVIETLRAPVNTSWLS